MAENNSGLIKLNSLTERQQTITTIQPSYDALCDRFYLETAADLALRSGDGTITRQKQAFLDNREKRMIELMHMMQTQSYTFSELHQKIIYEPKKRIIDVPDFFPDRIIERAATDLIKPLIIDSLVRTPTVVSKVEDYTTALHKSKWRLHSLVLTRTSSKLTQSTTTNLSTTIGSNAYSETYSKMTGSTTYSAAL